MSFDPRSRARLEALGRRLPQPLPRPEPAQPSSPEVGRHRLETEQDPEQLFRELMQASPDGSVPPHLLERLRELEQRRTRQQRASAMAPIPAAAPGAAGDQAASRFQGPDRPSPGRLQPKQKQKPQQRRLGRQQPPAPEELELYTAFQQLLLEDDGLD